MSYVFLDSQSQGESPVDLENDGHQRAATDLEEIARAYSQRGPGLTQGQKNKVVEYHNKLREGEGASNMEKLVGRLRYAGYNYIVVHRHNISMTKHPHSLSH